MRMGQTRSPRPLVVGGRRRVRFRVRGVVQGVGFRPFVYVTATDLGLTGSVANDSAGLTAEVEGEAPAVAAFEHRLRHDAPRQAVVEEVAAEELAVVGGSGFTIAGSTATDGARTPAPPDLAGCGACLAEVSDPADRRYRHPFATCTGCGPRYTIITALPYDRPRTTMARFPMCAACAREYADPADRRFHAQPIACPDCGPTLELVVPGAPRLVGGSALRRARERLAGGAVLAVKGIGGYHLACDAGDERAVAALRRRKRRGDKPFAVMVRDLDGARGLCRVGPEEAALLASPRRPIVLLARGPGADGLAPSVAPGNPDLGVLLADTPLHHLLLGLPGDPPGPAALVMTSGNLGGEPIAFDDDDALARLAPLVDGWLRHDRPIHVPCDDPVSRVVDGVEVPVRRSRGDAPLPVALPFEVPATLAVGGDLKSACCLAEGRYAWLSPQLGDMDDLTTLEAFTAAERHLEGLTGVVPARLVVDLHPAYRSAAWARRHAAGRPVTAVQHHHAHVAAVMGEHGLDGTTPVIGIAFDGTGHGTDGTAWGGEVLLADYRGFRRFAHLLPVRLPGGDAAVRRPYRMALAHLAAAGMAWDDDLAPVAACPAVERGVLAHQLDTGLGCVPTSSMGRLFDTVASLAGLRQEVEFEAQAAIELEAAARGRPDDDRPYRFGVVEGGADGALVADPGPVLRAVVADVRAGAGAGVVAARFHGAVTGLVATLAGRARLATGLGTVALAGGVFQNPTLLSAVGRRLGQDGFDVLRPRRLPPNDGGLALGQVLVAGAADRPGRPSARR